ncbi:diheme cytochrome c [Beggiatoa leptomitoformis]|uniref:Diacylglycerol kinase n=1 Tax=Beggiatoa leptomitoformis TaxID=288004 RepID=A0A2N9YDY8_9GAMM|nr:diheme cytochrome c [Beggiatoa leptomitoformis]ALG68925.1 diacylglycerol kinase [Beggiatoa leptomitoformis]AUI68694.1 diacylglycerol kinase [Beggiatoa leptomitoformis]
MKYQTGILLLLTALSIVTTPLFAGERGEREERETGGNVQSTLNADYVKECGGCHFAYQPALLPARSWTALMGSLDKHFGENAELATEQQQAILSYLTDNAADKGQSKLGKTILKGLQTSETPLRITETAYFRRKHDEIPAKLVAGNPDVKSFSRCDACHTTAEKGLYSEKTVDIPNHGRWDDD